MIRNLITALASTSLGGFVILAAAYGWLAWSTPAHAQEACVTVEQDKALAEQKGLEYLGLHELPFTDEQSVFYAYRGQVWVSPVLNGCVAPNMYRAGKRKPEATPA